MKTVISYAKEGKWIHYNLVNQTMIRTSVPPEELSDKNFEIKDKLLYLTDEKELMEYNRKYYSKIREELVKPRDFDSPFLPTSEVMLTLWYDCNFACPYCFQLDGYYNEARKAGKINVSKVIDFLKLKSNNGQNPPKTITLVGGEPLLLEDVYKEPLLKILSFLNHTFTDIRVHIITNGYNLLEYANQLASFANVNYCFTLTFGSSSTEHKNERILKSDTKLNTYDQIKKGLGLISEKIPKADIILRMNFGKDYKKIAETKKMMQEINELNIDLTFELSPVTTSTVHQEINSEFLKLARDLIASEEFRDQITFKLEDPLLYIIRNSIPKRKEKEVQIEKILCNAILFTHNYDLSADFFIQPCEEFKKYERNQNKITISKTTLEELDRRAEECQNCPLFDTCFSNPCKIIKRNNLSKQDCYNREIAPILLAIKEFY